MNPTEKTTEQRRVQVYSGDGSKDLGFGTYVGDVTLYAFVSNTNMEIRSGSNPEIRPNDATIAAIEKEGFTLTEMHDNPKIVLDSGETVYGCQVWWDFA